jgi:hypothetical protein
MRDIIAKAARAAFHGRLLESRAPSAKFRRLDPTDPAANPSKTARYDIAVYTLRYKEKREAPTWTTSDADQSLSRTCLL